MKLIDLLERNQQQTDYAFHGTSDVLLDTILSNGMDPTPAKRVYDGSGDDGHTGSVASMDGVYFSKSFGRAHQYGVHATDKLGGNPMVVIIQFVKNSEGIDEDDVYDWINHMVVHNPEGIDGVDDFVQVFHRKFRVSDKADPNHLKAIFKIIKYVLDDKDFRAHSPFNWVRKLYIRDISLWLKMREHLSQVLASTGRGRESQNTDTFRINRPIGFRGKTRIVAIINGSLLEPNVLYGKVPKGLV